MFLNKAFSRKVKTINIFLFFLGLILVASCLRWQIVYSSDFKNIAEGRIYSSELNSLRGSIYASDGSTLAYSEPRFDMYFWMQDIEKLEEWGLQTREELVNKVAPIIDLTPEKLEQIMREFQDPQDSNTPSADWFPVAKSLTADQWRKLSNLKTTQNDARLLQGYKFEYTSVRQYPENRLLSHILGLTNKNKNEIYGLGGVEQAWNGDLSPRDGLIIKENDAIGQAITSALVPTIEPQRGSSLYTSIDKKLQKIVEEQLKSGVERFEAKSGTIIIMDPKNGEIMAFAHYPDYNPNLREEKNAEVYTNSALTAPYEMGSVGKVLTIAAAIDLKIITPDTIILENGHEGCEKFTHELEPLCTWDKKPMPAMPAWECFMRSDNICFFHIGEKLKKEDFDKYLKGFGIGQITGIDVTGEDPGYLPDVANWNIGDIAAFSYGHGYLVNTAQALSAVSAIPNKGIRMKPHIVKRVVKGDGEVIDFTAEALTKQERVISEETAQIVGEIMHRTYLNDIKDYETWYSDLRNYKIGMKSGTALIANQTGYTSDVNSTQLGFDLSPERKFIMLVRVERPAGGQLSFYNSRILWLDTFAAIKDHLQIPRK